MNSQSVIDRVRDVLGTPYFFCKNCIIYCMDCIEGMSRLTDCFVDLTVTSPPYNIGKEYEAPLPVDEYLQWSANWISMVHNLTMPGGAFWLNVGYIELEGRAKAIPIPYLLWREIPFFLVQEIVWNYGAGVAAKRSFSPRNEKFLWYVNDPCKYVFNLDQIRDKNVKYPNQKKNGKLRCNPNGKNPSDVWQIPKVTSGTDRSSPERTAHPAQFPEAVVDRIVKACSYRGDLILDPFMGSGTTAAIAVRNDRSFVGFEINKEYCRIAERRVLNEIERQRQCLIFNGEKNGELVIDDHTA